jgi:hypothetical protein
MNASVAELGDRDVLAALGQVTEELGANLDEPAPLADPEEARAALAALLRETGVRPEATPQTIVADDEAAPAVGREVLSVLLTDDVSHDAAVEAVQSPPPDDQLSIELALAGAVVLGALITWLQTKVHIKVKREAGETSFEFELTKDATDPETIKEVASTVGGLI